MSEPQRRRSSVQPPSLCQAIEGQQGRAADEHEDLDGVVVGHGAHAAQGRVEARQRNHRHRADPEAVDLDPAQRQVHFRQQRREHDAPGENAHRDLRHDERDERHDGQDVARAGGEAPFEELRHGEDQRAGIERHEHPRQHEQAPGVQARNGPSPPRLSRPTRPGRRCAPSRCWRRRWTRR